MGVIGLINSLFSSLDFENFSLGPLSPPPSKHRQVKITRGYHAATCSTWCLCAQTDVLVYTVTHTCTHMHTYVAIVSVDVHTCTNTTIHKQTRISLRTHQYTPHCITDTGMSMYLLYCIWESMCLFSYLPQKFCFSQFCVSINIQE